MNTKTDASYGMIPLRKTEVGWQTLLINQFSRIGNNTYWVFPKGHAEGEKSPLEAATRELHEETGLTATSILAEPQFVIEYSFIFKETKIEKTVTFYLALIEGDPELTLDPEEVREADWFTLTDAEKRVDYNGTKRTVREVARFLEENPEPRWR